jgi:hypothetical protein
MTDEFSAEVPSLRARQILRALAEVDAQMDVLEAQRAAVLAIHFGAPAVGTTQLFCASCRDKYGGRPTWPCATARAAGAVVSVCPSKSRRGTETCGLVLESSLYCEVGACKALDRSAQ